MEKLIIHLHISTKRKKKEQQKINKIKGTMKILKDVWCFLFIFFFYRLLKQNRICTSDNVKSDLSNRPFFIPHIIYKYTYIHILTVYCIHHQSSSVNSHYFFSIFFISNFYSDIIFFY